MLWLESLAVRIVFGLYPDRRMPCMDFKRIQITDYDVVAYAGLQVIAISSGFGMGGFVHFGQCFGIHER